MCQILTVGVRCDKELIEKCVFDYKDKIKHLLDEKGGESYSLTAVNTLINDIVTVYCFDESEFDNAWNEFSEKILKKLKKWSKESVIRFMFFSRQAPEMEHGSDDIKPAPYLENNKYVWLHGTVSNLPQIEKALNKKFTVDTQAIAYYEELAQKDIAIKGVFTAVVYELKTGRTKWLYNGIGQWSISYIHDDEEITWEGTTENIKMFTPSTSTLKIMPDDGFPYYYYLKSNKDGKLDKHYYVAFSGGMDIVMSTYVNIKNNIIKVSGNLLPNYDLLASDSKRKYIFVYFDYGARAREYEIAAMKKFCNLMKKEFPHIEFEYRIVDVKNFFNEISKINNYQSKLMNADSVGDIRETEDNLAYVPYRNTEFALLLGAMIDKDLEEKLFLPYIVFGLNLTEMSVYVDNTFAWVQAVENAVMYGGKNYKKVNVITPFINVTKTNMLAYMLKNYGHDKIKKLLDISFSCYYPDKNGKPCGKCGSCILREKAFERATKIIKKLPKES